jgi:competence ComEA-like helix-hairpin-helix protein
MQSRNLFIYNVWEFISNRFRLTFLAFCLLICFTNFSCSKHQVSHANSPISRDKAAININEASAEELEKLPNIGNGLANRIQKHREKYGKFRRVEQLMLVRGISDAKFREIQTLVKVE